MELHLINKSISNIIMRTLFFTKATPPTEYLHCYSNTCPTTNINLSFLHTFHRHSENFLSVEIIKISFLLDILNLVSSGLYFEQFLNKQQELGNVRLSNRKAIILTTLVIVRAEITKRLYLPETWFCGYLKRKVRNVWKLEVS